MLWSLNISFSPHRPYSQWNVGSTIPPFSVVTSNTNYEAFSEPIPTFATFQSTFCWSHVVLPQPPNHLYSWAGALFINLYLPTYLAKYSELSRGSTNTRWVQENRITQVLRILWHFIFQSHFQNTSQKLNLFINTIHYIGCQSLVSCVRFKYLQHVPPTSTFLRKYDLQFSKHHSQLPTAALLLTQVVTHPLNYWKEAI